MRSGVPQRVPAATSYATYARASTQRKHTKAPESRTSSLGRPEITTRVRALDRPGTVCKPPHSGRSAWELPRLMRALLSISPATPDCPPRTGVTQGYQAALADGRGGLAAMS